MYTRMQNGERASERRGGTAAASAFYNSGREYERERTPLLIPKDYRGEFLREHRAFAEQPDPIEEPPTEPSPIVLYDEDTPTDIPTEHEHTVSSGTDQKETGSLIGGLYHLLIGVNGAEEETILLLAIALLLLWGHLDRGGLFDSSAWDADDLALLLIGYLLLS